MTPVDGSSAGSEPPRSLRHHAIVGSMLAALSVLHFASDVHAMAVHDLLFKATFVPLILAGLWFRPRVALTWSVLTSAVYLWHVFGDLAHHGHDTLWVGDIALYNVVTAVTAVLSRRRAEAFDQARRDAAKLEENARSLLRAETTLRRGERLRAIGELAAGMAHEIRNPLGGIRGAAEVLRRGDATPEVTTEFWGLLDTEVTRLDDVVANFLRFARPPKPALSVVSVRDTTAAVLLLLSPEAKFRRITLRNDVGSDFVVKADESLLRQVLLNLALNSVQAQPHGGLVRVEAQRDDGEVTVSVSDSGAGVPEQLRESLFDAYVTSRAEGTGLGLAVAARLVSTMGGTLVLADTGEQGSTFRFTLPSV